MALTVCTCFDKYIKNKNAYIGAVVGAFLISIIDALSTMGSLGVSGAWVDALVGFEQKLPLASFGLAWVIPAIVCAILASFIPRRKDTSEIVFEVYDEGQSD